VPYTSSPSHGINRTIRHLKDVIPRLNKKFTIRKAVLAVGAQLPAASVVETDEAKEFFNGKGIEFEVWDSQRIHSLLGKHLSLSVPEFSIENLQYVLGKQNNNPARSHKKSEERRGENENLSAGEHPNIIVLCADFCSYSKFVQCSGSNRDLVISIMGRFYRETRKAVISAGGKVDKFMGDGLLAFWSVNGSHEEAASKLNKCLTELIGISLNLASEWQDQIDLVVNPKGLRAGAAYGGILMISEMAHENSTVHAIGECINIAARLQNEASPNSLIISNKLKTTFFERDINFKKLDPRSLKNIGEAILWKRDYATSP
jgi:class 3 adenylate cyclase